MQSKTIGYLNLLKDSNKKLLLWMVLTLMMKSRNEWKS